LASIIDRGVDQIDAGFNRMGHRSLIRFIVGVSALAEISANTKGGDGNPERGPSKKTRLEIKVTLGKRLGTNNSRA